MALVAYASSDEGESSDAEESPEQITKAELLDNKLKNNGKKTDEHDEKVKSQGNDANNFETGDSFPIEDDEYDILPNQNVGLTLPPPKHAAESSSQSSTATEHSRASSILSALPAPQTKTGQMIGFEQEDELEDEVKPKEKQLADVPLPPSKQKKKQGVKITVPSMDDYDSDEDEPKKKKLKPAQGKSGLFSLLPAPKNATTKEVGRVLLPHNLSKKSSAMSGKATRKVPTQTVSKPVYGELNIGINDSKDDSDDEEESVNFFSLGKEDHVPTVAPVVQDIPAVKDRTAGPMHEPSLRGPWLGPAAPASDLLGPPQKPAGAPLPSYSSKTLSGIRDDGMSSRESPDLTAAATASSSDSAGPLYTAQYSADYGQNYYPEVGEVQSFMHDEEFLKLQGKKARGKEEINIIDVHGDDQISEVDLMKHMTEEKDMRSFGKKGKDMPSSQQRRKHQITYLAHQAKERELELKNAWAQNRQTRRQTQSKYGF